MIFKMNKHLFKTIQTIMQFFRNKFQISNNLFNNYKINSEEQTIIKKPLIKIVVKKKQ